MNYGVGERIELNYNVACLRAAAGDAAERGLGNSGVGLKWRFLESADSHLTASVAPQFEFRTPGSDAARRGLADDENTFILPLQLAWDSGWLAVCVEAGRTFPSKTAGGWFGGLAAGRQLTERVSLGADLHGGWDGQGRSESLVLRAGARIGLSGGHMLLLSAGRELRNRHAPRATLMSYVGWQLSL